VNPALDMQRERALAIARELAARAPEGAIATIFAGGSLGRGEVWSADVDGRTEVYSDVDLYVVARAPSDVIGIRSVAASLKAGEVSPSSARFLLPTSGCTRVRISRPSRCVPAPPTWRSIT
jgi:hypothetical protein